MILTRPRENRRQRGFTLIELTVVLLIMGILSAVAAPRYFGALDRFRADATAKRIAADLEMARRQAKQSSTTQTVEFFVADDRYVLTGFADLDHPSQEYEIYVDESEYASQLVSADFGGASKVTFNIYGQPDSVGTVTIQSGTAQRQIKVDDNGFVTLP